MAEDHGNHPKDHKDDKLQKGPGPKTAKRPNDDDDDDDDAAPRVVMKQKTLATALSRSIVIATVVGALAYTISTLFSARYELIPAPNTNNNFVYRLDRLTGGVRFCGQQQCVEVIQADTSK